MGLRIFVLLLLMPYQYIPPSKFVKGVKMCCIYRVIWRFYCVSLKASQMPAMPPAALKRTEETEKKLSPQSAGMKPPTVEPTKSPNQMSFWDSMR